MKKLLISLASTLSPVLVALAAAPAHGYLWECPYSNFLLTEDGRCIDLTYMVSDGEREKPVGKTGRHPFPEWMISADPKYREQKLGAITEVFEDNIVYLGRFAQNGYELIDNATDDVQWSIIMTLDCQTGWNAVLSRSTGQAPVLTLEPPPSKTVAADRVVCITSGIRPGF